VTPITLATVAPLNRWVGWCNQGRNGKQTKVPFQPRTGELAKADDPAGWASRPEVHGWARAHVNGSGGGAGLELGSVEGEDYAFGGIDLDTCRDPATGMIEPWALEAGPFHPPGAYFPFD
jgi:primase-polymerase (primpol)-like protein